ncbi:MAG: DNA/RNA nuclease SfsA [Deltaproteobacteria bacterium]|nr:DNA/RNA nuclease SfsA [Deltaproteobacteria bacterium]
MRFPTPLIEATFLRRYQRFLVDVRMADGALATVHCPNTGSMAGLLQEGAPCLLLDSQNPARRLRYTMEAIRVGRTWVGAHPVMANVVGREAIEQGLVEGLGPIESVRAEVAYGRGSRADLVVQERSGTTWYVEIKSASLAEGHTSMFPDAVTERGLKHLGELTRVVRAGGRALMLFVATRDDVDRFRPAAHIDPAYAKGLWQAERAGVTLRALTSRTTRTQMRAMRAIPVEGRPGGKKAGA